MSKETHIFFLAVQEEPRGSTANPEMTEVWRLHENSDCVALKWQRLHCVRSNDACSGR